MSFSLVLRERVDKAKIKYVSENVSQSSRGCGLLLDMADSGRTGTKPQL